MHAFSGYLSGACLDCKRWWVKFELMVCKTLKEKRMVVTWRNMDVVDHCQNTRVYETEQLNELHKLADLIFIGDPISICSIRKYQSNAVNE